ncbi:MAG: aldose epimerase family protein [Desulfobacterales bacterium]|nr:aldose epimerase family protein [Desulfobacterales bacterium]
MPLTTSPFGQTGDGTAVDLYSLTNNQGMQALITNYGTTLVALKVPDQFGNTDDVTLGFDTFEAYQRAGYFFGCIVGRYANRIAGGKFTLGSKTYVLEKNEGHNHLHGGSRGFDKAVWQAEKSVNAAEPALILNHTSRDGEGGYPGNLAVTVTYRLTDENELKIDYEAQTDAPTVINLTHHAYYNLAGAGSGDITGHTLTLFADHFTPVDPRLIPTGELHHVAGTPMDFRQPTEIGARIEAQDEQLLRGNGYDHNWVLNKGAGVLDIAARVTEPRSGRVMEVYTTEPGIQFYTGNFLDEGISGRDGQTYGRRGGFCLETQHFPNSPNQPEYPSTVLNPGHTYRQTTIYRFSTTDSFRTRPIQD